MADFKEIQTYDRKIVRSRQPKFVSDITFTAKNAPEKIDKEWIASIVLVNVGPGERLLTPGNFYRIRMKGGDTVFTNEAGKVILDL